MYQHGDNICTKTYPHNPLNTQLHVCTVYKEKVNRFFMRINNTPGVFAGLPVDSSAFKTVTIQ